MGIMNDMERYRHLNEYYKEKFGERTLKICVDGGFTCPNRDGTKGYGGCIYCSEKGSGELINNVQGITEQIKYYFTTYRAERANKFIVYFQNFTNTYDTIENLKVKYDAALIDDRIIGEIINRRYTSNDFTKAVEILNKYDIDVITHIMVGLPEETHKDVMDTVDFINKHKVQGVKIHSTYVVENTKLAQMYKNGEYKALDIDDYIETLIDIMTHLRPDIIIHRISGDSPKDILVAPNWNKHKMWILHGFEKRFRARDLWQGKFYES